MANTNELSAIMRNLTVGAEQRATKTVTAVAQVLGTPELLEGILSHLPVLDLVVLLLLLPARQEDLDIDDADRPGESVQHCCTDLDWQDVLGPLS